MRSRGASLRLHGRDGGCCALEFEVAEFHGLVSRLLREGGAEAALRWSRTGTLDARSLLERWCREDLVGFPVPATAVVRSGSHFRSGSALQIETEVGHSGLPRMASELLRLMRSRGSVREVEVRAVAEGGGPEAGPGDAAERSALCPEDLDWLLPGEWLHSPRLGRVRLKRVDRDRRRFLLRNAGGELLSVTAEELQAGFRRVEA
ncbi:MAG: hypothetical protein ISR76_07380 [Planctomycetes bacterium]|nr:hypothetical protein [Planctomycetota bacterium]MBL7008804.1 hypothetical protein [Planctomycetota bacterium]